MNTIKLKKNKAKIIAHRGLSGIECENSIAAFVAAGNRSYFGIETDIHVTADKKFVIHHDDSAQRMTGVDVVMEETTLENLQKLPLYNKEEGKFRTDLYMPFLQEYIEICKKYEKKAILELKKHMEFDVVKSVVEIIKELNYLEETVFISFDFENLVFLRQILPYQHIQFLCKECDDELIEKLKQYNFQLDISRKAVTKKLVKKIHKAGLKINCWTCDDKKEAEKLLSYGVDYITTNILD